MRFIRLEDVSSNKVSIVENVVSVFDNIYQNVCNVQGIWVLSAYFTLYFEMHMMNILDGWLTDDHPSP